MLGNAETGIGHVTSTTTSGKYLNPDMYDGFLDEMYSKKTPLDLLIETCNNIGKDSDTPKSGAKQIYQRTSLREPNKNWFLSRQLKLGTSLKNDEKSIVSEGFDVFNTRSKVTEDSRQVLPSEHTSFDQEQPQDLRRRSNAISSDGVSSMESHIGGNRCRTDNSSSVNSNISSLSSSPVTGSDGSLSSPTEMKRRLLLEDSKNREEVEWVENSRDDFVAKNPSLLSPLPRYDSNSFLRQYLELQALARVAILQEHLNYLRQVSLAKPSTMLNGISQEIHPSFNLPDILASNAVLSKLQMDEAVGRSAVVGGALPFTIPYFGGICGNQFTFPQTYQQYLEHTTSGFLPGLLQVRPAGSSLESNSTIFDKHLDLLRHLSNTGNSSQESIHEITRDTSRVQFHRGPSDPVQTGLSRLLDRRHNADRGVDEEDIRRNHPYRRPSTLPTKTPISPKKPLNRHTAFLLSQPF